MKYATVRKLLQTGGKPSTWFPPGGLVEILLKSRRTATIRRTAMTTAAAAKIITMTRASKTATR